MLTLVNQGLMEPVRNRGFLVIAMSPKDRADISEMRLWLEVPAMAKLARQRDVSASENAHYRVLASDIVDAAREGDLTAFLEFDRKFHLGLTALLDNPRLTATVGELRDRTRLYGLESLKERGALVDSALEHVQILDSLLAGDVARTEQLMATHVGHVLVEWAGDEEAL